MCTKFNSVKQLISGLTKSEKRYFHVFSTRHIIDTKLSYFELYELVRKPEITNFDTLTPHYPQLKKQSLEIALSRLYDQLLACLTLFHTQADPELQLNQQLSHIHLLIKRELRLEAEHELNKCLQHIIRHQQWDYLYPLFSIVEYNLSIESPLRLKLKNLYIEKFSISEKEVNVDDTSSIRVETIINQLDKLTQYSSIGINTRLKVIEGIMAELNMSAHTQQIKKELQVLAQLAKIQVTQQDYSVANSGTFQGEHINYKLLSTQVGSRYDRLRAITNLYQNNYAQCRKMILQLNPATCSVSDKLVDEFIVIIALLSDTAIEEDFIRQRFTRLNRLIKKTDYAEEGLIISNLFRESLKCRHPELKDNAQLHFNHCAKNQSSLYTLLHSYLDLPFIFGQITELRSVHNQLKLVG